MKIHLGVRGIVIEHSVAVEQIITNQICLFLGIDKKTSKAFGTTNQSMSFNDKISLLTELNFYDKVQKEKLTRFSEIRNKFAHLIEIKTFSDCFLAINGLLKRMEEWYPETAQATYSTPEERYKAFYWKLFIEIGQQVERFVEFYNNRLYQKNELEVKTQHFDLLIESLIEIGEEYKHQPVVEEYIKKVLTLTEEKYKKSEVGS